MSIFKHTIFVLLTLLILFFPKSIYAVTVRSYLVTEAKEFYGDPHLETVYYYKVMNFDYQSGKIVLSHNPDGTGEALVGEVLNVSQSFIAAFGYDTTGINDCIAKPMKPLDITPIAKKGYNNIHVRFKRKCNSSYQKIDQLYLVHFDDYDPDLTPFLDLPWDYQAKGKAFEDVALEMSSYFDHEYPLLSVNWVLNEPTDVKDTIIKFGGQKTKEPYTSHDGYDYGLKADVFINDPVVAVAPGQAIYIDTCGACGNAIHIDHENGYQTRYYHLQNEGLITNIPNKKVQVVDRQQIGKVGLTGNTDGPHIHFMVIHDKNGDGNFDDNIPDGLVDPYGWQSDNPDPWENYNFTLYNVEKNGAKSKYLWKHPLKPVTKAIHTDGGQVTNNRYTIIIPKNFINQDLYLKIETIPVSAPSVILQPIAPGSDVTIWDGIETFFTNFQKFFTLKFVIGSLDISRLIPETLSIYSSQDGVTWEKEISTVDWEKRQIFTDVNHLSQFVVMGEKIDSIAPITTAIISGTPTSNPNEYTNKSQVTMNIDATDEPVEGSLGIDYTVYKVNDDKWQIYENPLSFSELGEYKISYYSVDKDGNIEDVKESLFSIVEQKQIDLEAQIIFDFESNNFVISAKDQTVPISTEIIKIKKKEYDQSTLSTPSDKLIILSTSKDTKKAHELAIKSLKYDDETQTELQKNTFKVSFDKDPSKKDPNKITQILNINKQLKVRLVYNKKKDITEIRINENGEKKKEDISGLKKLSVYTSHGQLRYFIE